MEYQHELQFDKNFKREESAKQLQMHPMYGYFIEAGNIYIMGTGKPDLYRIEARVFQGPEVDWTFIMRVDFDTAAYFLHTGLADLHWSLRDRAGEFKRFSEWI